MTPEQRKEALELAKRRILHQSDAHRGYIDLFLVANALIAAESELSTQRRESVPIGKGVGFDEVYCEWFKCGACGDSGCGLAMKYCPNCGRKLRWPKKVFVPASMWIKFCATAGIIRRGDAQQGEKK